ncbi:MAG TPA: hypothetical protein PK324_13025, partial [Nocardioides sp.]|nr:hypothetical protein [Nocardioides sp.]
SPYYTCSTPVALAPGRYGASFPARSMNEYGTGNPAFSFAGAACTMVRELMSAFSYENAIIACDPDYFFRGQGNWRALVFKVQALADGDDLWRSRTIERTVANGGLGCRYGQCWDTLREDFELSVSSQVRVCVAMRDSRIGVGATVRLEQTPSFSELKVATVNVHQSQGGGLATGTEFLNMSNLLATRGRFVPERRTVAELDYWAPFEWAADIVMFQEMENELVTGIVANEAEVHTDLDWRWIFGAGKRLPEVGYVSYNSVLTHELLVPGGKTGDITARDTDKCESSSPLNGSDHRSECYNEDWLDGTVITGGFPEVLPFHTYVVPARVAVRRWSAGADTPILVYSVILEPHHRFVQRRAELEAVIATIKAHMAAQPGMSDAAGDPSPTAAGHRVILAGDFNFYPHEVGEHRWFVRRLREEFGYAIDTAAADRDSWANFYDMHAFRGAAPSPDDGLPAPYTEGEHWQPVTSLAYKFWWGQGPEWSHHFPYWATTYHGVDSDYGAGKERERHDAVLLVGKGWAKDDPVRKYIVMHTTVQYDSPFAIKDGQGRVLAVDIAPYEANNDKDVPNVLDGRRNYAPQRPLSIEQQDGMLLTDTACTAAGCAAIETDHIPVGVRLRVTR